MPSEHPDSLSAAAVSRRGFLQASGAAIALVVGFRVAPARSQSDAFVPNAFVRIDGQGHTTLVMPQVEMGQGIYTAVAMILAEELDARWEHVSVEHAPPSDQLYANPYLGLQATGNSNSIRAFWTPLRTAGATARAMLVDAAARRWGVAATECRTENGAVVHGATGRELSYGDLAAAASELPPPAEVVLKSPGAFRLIGKPLLRLDTPDKVNGKAIYGIDVRPAGVKYATLAACPVRGGKVRSVDDSRAKRIEGVRQIVVLDDLVAVVGDNQWAAKQGLAALSIAWDEGANAAFTSDLLWQQMRAASESSGAVAKNEGDVDAGLARGELVEATYELPLLAHAQLEPLNCTAHVRPDACEVWLGTQVLTRARAAAARAAGVAVENVTIHNHLLGGAFGRRLEVVEVERALRIAKEVEGPVKVVWTREEDVQQDVFRPMYHDRMAASLAQGSVVAWHHRVTGPSIAARWLPAAFREGVDFDAVDGAVELPYDIPNVRVEYVRHEIPPVRTGFWRGVGPNNNVFAVETFIDELAAKAARDPLDFRRDLLG
jgi:isoquinoline 1-oxidoreductase beta subunit